MLKHFNRPPYCGSPMQHCCIVCISKEYADHYSWISLILSIEQNRVTLAGSYMKIIINVTVSYDRCIDCLLPQIRQNGLTELDNILAQWSLSIWPLDRPRLLLSRFLLYINYSRLSSFSLAFFPSSIVLNKLSRLICLGYLPTILPLLLSIGSSNSLFLLTIISTKIDSVKYIAKLTN